jgi:hypothetical protein
MVRSMGRKSSEQQVAAILIYGNVSGQPIRSGEEMEVVYFRLLRGASFIQVPIAN